MWLFIHRPFEIWPICGTLRVERVYMLVTVVWWLLYTDKSWIKNPLNAAFAMFGLALTAAWAASPWSDLGTKTVEDWFKVAIFYVLVMSTVRTEQDLKRLVVMYLAVVGLYMAHSLWEYRAGRHVWAMGTVRMLGIDTTYGDPNTFAATIVYSLPLAVALWPHAERVWHRVLLAGYAGLSALCVLLTSSRSGFVGLCFLALMVVVASNRRLAWVLLLAIAAPVAWTCLPQDRQNRFLTLVDPSYGPANAKDSAEGRAKGWRDGVRLWSERPAFGVGPGAFGTATRTGFESHQLYGQVLGELGTAGAVAFASILAAFLANALAMRRRCPELPKCKGSFAANVSWAVGLTVMLMLLLGFGGHNLYRYTWLWFGAFQAIALHCTNRPEELEAVDADNLAVGEIEAAACT
jgi:O-antigen ligase